MMYKFSYWDYLASCISESYLREHGISFSQVDDEHERYALLDEWTAIQLRFADPHSYLIPMPDAEE